MHEYLTATEVIKALDIETRKRADIYQVLQKELLIPLIEKAKNYAEES